MGRTQGHAAHRLAKTLQVPCNPRRASRHNRQRCWLLRSSQDLFSLGIRGQKSPQNSLVLRKCRMQESTLPLHL